MRKAISKKTRFEIFKRDGFTCQYCGAVPPAVLLHVDHIVPVAEGGLNDEENLITACEPCNLGKGARSLNVAPQSLADRATEVEEREAQVLGYQQILAAKRERLDAQAWEVMTALYGELDSVNKANFLSVKTFIDRMGFDFVYVCAEIASSYSVPLNEERLFRYFCGVYWGRVKRNEGEQHA